MSGHSEIKTTEEAIRFLEENVEAISYFMKEEGYCDICRGNIPALIEGIKDIMNPQRSHLQFILWLCRKHLREIGVIW